MRILLEECVNQKNAQLPAWVRMPIVLAGSRTVSFRTPLKLQVLMFW
jgi:hypothetical protein